MAGGAVKALTVLGATGSVGVSTLDVVARNPGLFRVVALTGNRNVERLAAQCRRFRPELAVVADRGAAERLAAALASDGLPTRIAAGPEALEEAAAHPEADAVMAAIEDFLSE